MNDVMRYLRENAAAYGCEFVDTIDKADIIITNDVFTPEAEASKKPRLKRMDGIFQEPEYKDRQAILNRAAGFADKIIFISKYARETYLKTQLMFADITAVALNVADPKVFERKPFNLKFSPTHYIAVATDWNRPEKNLKGLLEIVPQLPFLTLIGTEPLGIRLPSNVEALGYCEETTIALALRESDVMICTSINDPAPKTVAQAVAVGLPIVYHPSGGVEELTQSVRFGVTLDRWNHREFDFMYRAICNNYLEYDPVQAFKNMLDIYFTEIKNLVDEHKIHYADVTITSTHPWKPISYGTDGKGNISLPDGPPFDGEPVLIRTRTGIVEAWWDPFKWTNRGYFSDDEWEGFQWICYDDMFQLELDDALEWCPIP